MAAANSQEEYAERIRNNLVLAAERAQLSRSREYLHLMREDVLSLKAMGGDPVSEEFLKADLYHRAEALKDIPDTPLFFGRLDYAAQPEPELPESKLSQPGLPRSGLPESGLPGSEKSGSVISEPGQGDDVPR